MVYPHTQYPWLTEPEGRRVRVLTGTGTGQPGITQGLPVLIPRQYRNVRVSREQQHVTLERPCTVEEKMLTQAGIEPATLSTLDWRSNQLSYCAVGRVWVINPYHYEDG